MQTDNDNTQVDTNLYSRQIGTFGMETMGKLIKMKVLIIGMRGLGVETAKNLILAGPKRVVLFDDEPTRLNDLGSNFYLEEKHVGKTSRAQASVEKLKELNPYVEVHAMDDFAQVEAQIKAGEFHVVCQTESLLNGKVIDQGHLDQVCRDNKVGYIASQTLGPWGFAFLDYGNEHVITDHDGEQTKQFIVTYIERGAKTVVTTHEDKRHTYQEGDHVVFREVEGMTQINDTQPIEIVSCTPNTITLDLDSTAFSEYTRQGVVENVKVPRKASYHSWT
jgi:ubiquitin-activating enzyme E1